MLVPDKNFFNKCNFPVGNILFVPVENIVVSASLVVFFFFFFFFFAKKDLETARIGSDRIGTQHNKVPLMVMMMTSMRNLNLHNHRLQSWLSVAFIAVTIEEEEAYGYETYVCTPDRLTAVAQRIHGHLQSGCRDNRPHKETLVFLQENQEREFRAGITYCWEEKEDRSAALKKSIGSRFPFKRLAAISV
jgi:hypothetical protein